MALHPRYRPARHRRVEHGAGAGHQEYRADADLGFRRHGAADGRRDRRVGLCRAPYAAGGGRYPADCRGGVDRRPARTAAVIRDRKNPGAATPGFFVL